MLSISKDKGLEGIDRLIIDINEFRGDSKVSVGLPEIYEEIPRTKMKKQTNKVDDQNNKNEENIKYEHEEPSKNDLQSQIDFDPEALVFDKTFFQDYSEGCEQKQNLSYLEENFEFIQKQHTSVMSHLHCEVDQLKQKNLELNLKLTELITQAQYYSNDKTSKAHKAKDTNRQTPIEASSIQKLKLVTEIDNLKDSLAFYKQENKLLASTVERYKQESSCDGLEVKHENKSSCQSIIQHLNQVNQNNINKIVRLKGDLHGALNSHNLPMSAFINSKGLAERDVKDKGVKEVVEKEEVLKKENGSILKRFTLPKLSSLRRFKQNKHCLEKAESSSGMLLPPIKNDLRGKEALKNDRPHFRP